MSLTAGTRLGPYEVLSPIGAGGMGEVYRARDTRLHRDVALKLLPELFALDPDRLARLEREAQVLAALNHPNIAAIYGFEHEGSLRALALEMVEGPTLADRIANGPIPIDEAMPIARQITAALEAAHEAGIVHRDLKPANIKVRDDGTVKVLDFGLAKAVEGSTGRSGSVSMSPTLTSPAMTGIGTILGTAAYMAPEQARGRVVDKRADIWAFGCVLYEMLTGTRAFDGSDVTDVLASVIKSDPDWTALPTSLPPAVRVVLQRCLQKDPGQRFRDIGDVRLALAGAFHTEGTSPGMAPGMKTSRWSTMLRTAAAIVVAAGVAGGTVWWLTRPARPALVKLSVLHAGAETVGGPGSDIIATPDGQAIAYVASVNGQGHLFVRPLDQLAATRLAAGVENVGNAFMSPDGQWVGFVDFSDRSIRKVAITGGPPLTIAKLPPNVVVNGATWGLDDRIVFGTNAAGLMMVAAGGATVEPLTKPDAAGGDLSHRQPEFLPDGKAVLFAIAPVDGQPENYRVALLDLESQAHTVLVRSGSNPRLAPTGHLLYASAGTVRAVGFDWRRREVHGNPMTAVEGVVVKGGGFGSFSIAPAGLLTYIAGESQTAKRTLVWVDRTGKEEPIDVPARAYAYARLSPDGRRIALDVRDEGNDIWTWDIARKALTRVTFDPGLNRGPVWSPDGRRIAFSAPGEGTETIHWQLADGSGKADRIIEGQDLRFPSDFSADGKWILFNQPATPPYDLGMVGVEGDLKPQLLLHEAFSETNGVISPNGKWLAYESDESGRDEIYVRPFPDVNTGRSQVSTNGGTRPLWSRDGRELFYYLPPGVVMSAPVVTGTTFTAGTPAVVFKGTYLSPQTGRMYDVTPDGRRFLMVKEARAAGDAPPPPQIVVVQNWLDELRRLVPVN